MIKLLVTINRLLLFVLFSFIVIGVSPQAYAQAVSVEASVDKKEVRLDSYVELTVTVNGSQDVIPVPFSNIEGFDVQAAGSKTSYTILNAQYSSSKTFVYKFYPLKVGEFEIPSLELDVDSKRYFTDAITITVIDIPGASKNTIQTQQPKARTLDDKLFVVLKAPDTEFYLNSPIPIKILLYANELSLRDINYPILDNVGFSEEGKTAVKQYQQVINGLKYDIVEFNKTIYPTRTGELNLGPLTVNCNILVASDKSNRRESVFDDPFFSDFFNRSEKRPIKIKSGEMVIKVKDLPSEGRPIGFNGAVGNYHFDASVGPSDVKEGDPLTLKMMISGEGHLKTVNFPKLDIEDQFKVYEPIIKDDGKQKRLEEVVIPKSSDIKEFPAINFSYFDPRYNKYLTITKGPFPINIQKVEGDGELRVIGLNKKLEIIEKQQELGSDIVFIKDRLGILEEKDRPFYKQGYYFIFLLLYGLLWGVVLFFLKRYQRLETDTVFAKRHLAPKHARKDLMQARRLMDLNKIDQFYDSLFKTLQHYLAHKFHLALGAVNYEAIKNCEESKRIDEKFLTDIAVTIEECDTIRFGSRIIDAKNMRIAYQRVEEIIDHIERRIK